MRHIRDYFVTRLTLHLNTLWALTIEVSTTLVPSGGTALRAGLSRNDDARENGWRS